MLEQDDGVAILRQQPTTARVKSEEWNKKSVDLEFETHCMLDYAICSVSPFLRASSKEKHEARAQTMPCRCQHNGVDVRQVVGLYGTLNTQKS